MSIWILQPIHVNVPNVEIRNIVTVMEFVTIVLNIFLQIQMEFAQIVVNLLTRINP